MSEPASRTAAGPASTGRRRAATVLAASALAALSAIGAACAGSDGSGTPSTTAAPAPRQASVSIDDLAFDPRRVEVAVGGSVTWVNDDETPHMLLSTTPNVIGSPLIGKAGSYTQEFSAPGEYRYYCTIHNSMKGVVVVR